MVLKFCAKIQQKNEICKFLDTKYEEKGKKLVFLIEYISLITAIKLPVNGQSEEK